MHSDKTMFPSHLYGGEQQVTINFPFMLSPCGKAFARLLSEMNVGVHKTGAFGYFELWKRNAVK